MIRKKHIDAIWQEYNSALVRNPDWSTYDVIHAMAKLVEEAGEVLREANHIHEGKGSYYLLQQELYQTGAMVLRCLSFIDEIVISEVRKYGTKELIEKQGEKK